MLAHHSHTRFHNCTFLLCRFTLHRIHLEHLNASLLTFFCFFFYVIVFSHTMRPLERLWWLLRSGCGAKKWCGAKKKRTKYAFNFIHWISCTSGISWGLLVLLLPPAATQRCRYYTLSFSARHSRKATSHSTHSSRLRHALRPPLRLACKIEVRTSSSALAGFWWFLCRLSLRAAAAVAHFFRAFMRVQVLNSCFLLVLVIVRGNVVFVVGDDIQKLLLHKQWLILTTHFAAETFA